MGIHGFNRILAMARDAGYAHIIMHTPPQSISSLLVDYNSILYLAKNNLLTEYATSSVTKSSADLQHEIGETTVNILNRIFTDNKPSKTLVVCNDGVSPDSKIKDQRRRRAQAYREAQEAKLSRSETIEAKIRRMDFGSEEFSPGTVFMDRLSTFTLEYLSKYEVVSSVENIYYSSHTVPGEGEHKIIEFFRKGRLIDSGSHVIVGNDSDLLVLSCLQNMSGIYIYRESDSPDKPKTWINIDVLKTYIYQLFDRTKIITDEDAVKEFSILINLLGNDFIPTPLALMIGPKKHNPIEVLFKTHAQLLATTNNKLYDPNIKAPSATGIVAMFRLLNIQERDLITTVSTTRNGPLFETHIEQVDYSEKSMTENSGPVFRSNGYENLVQYWRVMELTMKDERDPIKNPKGSETTRAMEETNRLCPLFVEGIFWTFRYYMGESVNYRWVYDGNLSPTFYDLTKYGWTKDIVQKMRVNVSAKSTFMTIPQQLYCIMPKVGRENVIDSSILSLIPTSSQDYTVEDFGLGSDSHIKIINVHIYTRNDDSNIAGVGDGVNKQLLTISAKQFFQPTPTLFFAINENALNLVKSQKKKDEITTIKLKRKTDAVGPVRKFRS